VSWNVFYVKIIVSVKLLSKLERRQYQKLLVGLTLSKTHIKSLGIATFQSNIDKIPIRLGIPRD